MDKLLVVFIVGFVCGAFAVIGLIMWTAITIDKPDEARREN